MRRLLETMRRLMRRVLHPVMRWVLARRWLCRAGLGLAGCAALALGLAFAIPLPARLSAPPSVVVTWRDGGGAPTAGEDDLLLARARVPQDDFLVAVAAPGPGQQLAGGRQGEGDRGDRI